MTEPDVTTGAAWRVIDHLRRCREIVVGVDDGSWVIAGVRGAANWRSCRGCSSPRVPSAGVRCPTTRPGIIPVCLQARHQGEAFR